ncbi:hypothetical protein J5N97_011275 [Dioscorea zingiberensis]|uniref:Receptor-like serine/threonine-protein kinase n=1 Tax=Dioscorea zingiberensis TaxID=325984 RepID=A0A9D5D2R7_9LILI|nr:hypothetical protein J5N97_011275 [Dioscorea zingiberensis]
MNTSSKMFRQRVLLSILFLISRLLCPSFSVDTLSPTQPLTDGQTLVSTSGTFALGFFSPAYTSKNRYVGIWYNNLTVHTIVWVANRRHPVSEASTGVLTLTSKGTLVLTTMQNSTTILWSSAPTSMNNPPVAQLLDNGNFVVRHSDEAAKHVAWQSFDHPTDTLLPGMKLGWDLTTGLNRNLTSWKSPDDPSPGDYCIAMDIRGDPQLVVSFGSVRKWRSGPWTGLGFNSIPEMVTYSRNGFSFDFVNNNKEIYYSYEISNRSIITRLVVNQTGKTERYVWMGQHGWSLFWFTPRSQCSGLDSCGPNGVCDPFGSRMCSCLQGFEPRSPRDWDMLDGSEGCVRKQPLDCRNGKDGFVKMVRTQLPDTWNSFVDPGIGLEECQSRCLMNCSCTAYANSDVRGGGSGCILWFAELQGLAVYLTAGQDLYVRVSQLELGSSASKSSKSGTIVVIIVIPATILLACATCTMWMWRKRKRNKDEANHHKHESEMKDKELELPLFDLNVILEATKNLAPENKLGQGGFGVVYKGEMGDGLEIAVKRLSKTSKQGIDEFKNEVMLITKLQHRNLVRLLGCCIQEEERMLIYEYMPNKSLDAFLFDFGMARIFGGDHSTTQTRKVVGTLGYMAPEYAMDGVFSVKSDVFSYGVLVLEIISGQKNRGVYHFDPEPYLPTKVWKLWNEGKISCVIDPSMSCYSYSMNQVMRCIQVGLLCVQANPRDRPTMSSVVFMLATENAPLPPPKQPGFAAEGDYYERGHYETTSSNAQNTITELVGR